VAFWDNLKPHQSEESIEGRSSAGGRGVAAAPAMGPDLTPIEEMISKVQGSDEVCGRSRTTETVPMRRSRFGPSQ